MSGQGGAFDLVAARFAELWRALTHNGPEPRDREEAKILIDRVRSALDRGQDRLGQGESAHFVADTFEVEALAYEGPRTQILRLRHRDLGTAYALKTLNPGHWDNPVYADLLREEARRHMMLCADTIVRAHMLLRLPDGRPALLLDWMEGGSLSQRLDGAAFAPEDMNAVMTALLDALRVVHAAGLAHADITPANLLFAGDRMDSLKLADFDTAVPEGSAGAEGLHTLSQLAAPECRAGGRPDRRSDLYACGRILEILLQHSAETGGVTRKFSDLAQRLTRQNPNQRPQSAEAALSLLQSLP